MLDTKNNRIALILSLAVIFFSCSKTKSIKYSRKRIPPKTSIAIIIDSPNNIKNVILAKFLKKGYNVKAINAADMYELSDIFDIKDLKKISYKGSAENSLLSMEKTYNNIYKLHIYNFEINKAELLSQIKSKWNVKYLILLDLKHWRDVCWARVIDLSSFEVIWLENYPTKYKDTLETVVDHFMASMVRK